MLCFMLSLSMLCSCLWSHYGAIGKQNSVMLCYLGWGGVLSWKGGGECYLGKGGECYLGKGGSVILERGGVLSWKGGGSVILERGGSVILERGGSVILERGGSVILERGECYLGKGGSVILERGGVCFSYPSTVSLPPSLVPLLSPSLPLIKVTLAP